jgi:hypothetical protein
LTILIFSVRLAVHNPFGNDEINETSLYETKKRSNAKFYLQLMKKKMWIVGTFGIYISVLLILALLNQLVFSLGIIELSSILNPAVWILAWGLIPFSLFWVVYIILYFSSSFVDIMKYEYGGFKKIGKESQGGRR